MKKKASQIQEIKNTIRTSNGLRDLLFEEIDLLRKNASNPAKARAVAALAGQIIQSVRIEIEMHRYVSDNKLLSMPKLPGLELCDGKR